MEPKTITESRISPALPPSEGVAPEVDVWDPPFERWIRLADVLLKRTPLRLPKTVIPAGSITIKH